jgi:hypothetical protein
VPPAAAAPAVVDVDGAVAVSTLAELEAAGRSGTALGQAALLLARRLDGSGRETGASVAALSRQHAAALAAVLAGAKSAPDALDELRTRRERKRAAG